MRRQRVWSFVVSTGFVVAAVGACVGGSGPVPEPIGGEGSSSTTGAGDSTNKNETDVPSAGSSGSKNPAPNETQPSCVQGSSCDCGSTQLVGTVKCTDAGQQCSCALRGDAS